MFVRPIRDGEPATIRASCADGGAPAHCGWPYRHHVPGQLRGTTGVSYGQNTAECSLRRYMSQRSGTSVGRWGTSFGRGNPQSRKNGGIRFRQCVSEHGQPSSMMPVTGFQKYVGCLWCALAAKSHRSDAATRLNMARSCNLSQRMDKRQCTQPPHGVRLGGTGRSWGHRPLLCPKVTEHHPSEFPGEAVCMPGPGDATAAAACRAGIFAAQQSTIFSAVRSRESPRPKNQIGFRQGFRSCRGYLAIRLISRARKSYRITPQKLPR